MSEENERLPIVGIIFTRVLLTCSSLRQRFYFIFMGLESEFRRTGCFLPCNFYVPKLTKVLLKNLGVFVWLNLRKPLSDSFVPDSHEFKECWTSLSGMNAYISVKKAVISCIKHEKCLAGMNRTIFGHVMTAHERDKEKPTRLRIEKEERNGV